MQTHFPFKWLIPQRKYVRRVIVSFYVDCSYCPPVIFLIIVSSLNVNHHNHTSCTLLSLTNWLSFWAEKSDLHSLIQFWMKDSSPAIRVILLPNIYIYYQCVMVMDPFYILLWFLKSFSTLLYKTVHNDCLYLGSVMVNMPVMRTMDHIQFNAERQTILTLKTGLRDKSRPLAPQSRSNATRSVFIFYFL